MSILGNRNVQFSSVIGSSISITYEEQGPKRALGARRYCKVHTVVRAGTGGARGCSLAATPC